MKHCSLADKEHKASKRQYTHVGHKAGNIICIARKFYTLPLKHKLGLIGHELGHLAGAAGELKADKLGSKFLGQKIKRVNSKYGMNLETV